jgi:hypothetical protein
MASWALRIGEDGGTDFQPSGSVKVSALTGNVSAAKMLAVAMSESAITAMRFMVRRTKAVRGAMGKAIA